MALNLSPLTTIGEPPLFVCTMGQSPFADLPWAIRNQTEGATVRMIRGWRARTLDDFFNEIAAALQFPYYFGENWPAFHEMILDLEWLPGEVYVLLIDDAHLLLDDDSPEDFAVLMRILGEANEAWLTPNKYMPRSRNPTPFHTLFRCDEGKLDTFVDRLKTAGANFAMLDLGTND